MRLAGYDIAPTARFVSTVQFHAPGVSLGPDSFCAHEVRFFGGPASEIRIGAGVEVGPLVTFVARTHHLGPPGHRAGAGKETTIVVGDGAWIGARAVIVGPCTIGTGAVISAGAVVRGDVPANVLWSGAGSEPDRPLPI